MQPWLSPAAPASTPRQDLRRPLRARRPTYDSDMFGLFAEQFARFMGTARFLMYMTLFVAVWIVWNLVAPADWRWDDYPFIFLTLMLSLQASYAAPLILLAQNRQEDRDKVIGRAGPAGQRPGARRHGVPGPRGRLAADGVGEVATRDFLRSELRGAAQRPRRAGRGEEDRRTRRP